MRGRSHGGCSGTGPETVNVRELTRTPGFPIKKDRTKDLNAAIQVLVELRWLARTESGAHNRPRGNYEVNLAVYEAQP